MATGKPLLGGFLSLKLERTKYYKTAFGKDKNKYKYYIPPFRDERIFEKGLEQIFKYIRNTKTSSNKYANILRRLKTSQTNI